MIKILVYPFDFNTNIGNRITQVDKPNISKSEKALEKKQTVVNENIKKHMEKFSKAKTQSSKNQAKEIMEKWQKRKSLIQEKHGNIVSEISSKVQDLKLEP